MHTSESEETFIYELVSLTISILVFVEVRDSRTGYFIPARYGMGVWPDGKIVGEPSTSVGILILYKHMK